MTNKQKDFIFETKYWEVYLNSDQYYLGRCVISCKREVSAMSDLTNEEWLDFAELSRKIEKGFKEKFRATMFNWTCLMNDAYKEEDPHPWVHWHMRPRYMNPIVFVGQKFEDNEFGHHYVRGTERQVPTELFNKIVEEIKTILER